MLNAQIKNGQNSVTMVAKRVDMALVAMIAGSPLCGNQNCATAIVWHMVARDGDWRKVIANNIFRLLDPDMRVAVLPLALGESLEEGSASHANMKELCNQLAGEYYCDPGQLAFTYLTALLVGYTIHRRYDTSDLQGTRDWLTSTLRRFYPEISPEIGAAELAKFEPFLTNPERFVDTKDRFQTTVLNTLVAIHNLDIPAEWKGFEQYRSAACLADRFYGVCERCHRNTN